LFIAVSTSVIVLFGVGLSMETATCFTADISRIAEIRGMKREVLDEAAIERAAIAIFEFDEDETDRTANRAALALTEPRMSWEELCHEEPETADGYRGRAKVAVLALMGAGRMAS
jgi:hypothetical protein